MLVSHRKNRVTFSCPGDREPQLSLSFTGCFHALRAQSFLLGIVRQHEARIKDLSEQIQEAEVANDVPPPIKEEQVEAILNDLRNLWREDVAAVAPFLRELTGPR